MMDMVMGKLIEVFQSDLLGFKMPAEIAHTPYLVSEVVFSY